MARLAKKVTFTLSEELLGEFKAAAKSGEGRSQNALVEAALREYLKKLKRERVRRAFDEASRDPLFLADTELEDRDFHHADAETARMIS